MHRFHSCVLDSVVMLCSNASTRPRREGDKTGETNLPSASVLQPDKTDITDQIFITLETTEHVCITSASIQRENVATKSNYHFFNY